VLETKLQLVMWAHRTKRQTGETTKVRVGGVALPINVCNHGPLTGDHCFRKRGSRIPQAKETATLQRDWAVMRILFLLKRRLNGIPSNG
jgi:hypothetical protein